MYLSGGYHAAGGLSLAFLAWMYFVLIMRGPQLPADKWLGWEGGWEMRRNVVLQEMELDGKHADV